MQARSSPDPVELEQGCIYLCDVIQKIRVWGLDQAFAYDGLAHLSSIGLPAFEMAEGTLEENLSDCLDDLPAHLITEWRDFLSNFSQMK